jgi:hypothetical protein
MREHEKYIVISTGRKNGQPYCAMAPVVSGAKENGDRYEFIDANAKTKRGDKERPFGAIVYFKSVEVDAGNESSVKKIALQK